MALKLFVLEYQFWIGYTLGAVYIALAITLCRTSNHAYVVSGVIFASHWLGLAWVLGISDDVISLMFFFALTGMLSMLVLLGWLLQPKRRLVQA